MSSSKLRGCSQCICIVLLALCLSLSRIKFESVSGIYGTLLLRYNCLVGLSYVGRCPGKTPLTELLQAWSRGDRDAFHQLVPLIHDHLRRLARQRLQSMARGGTMQATALVNELYLRLVDAGNVSFRDRAHFFAISANLMRQILIDQARTRSRVKRGGEWRRISLEDSDIPANNSDESLLALDEAMDRLAAFDGRKARVVELRFFGGLTNQEIAEAGGISVDTVKRDWSFAKLWLARELKSDPTVNPQQ